MVNIEQLLKNDTFDGFSRGKRCFLFKFSQYSIKCVFISPVFLHDRVFTVLTGIRMKIFCQDKPAL